MAVNKVVDNGEVKLDMTGDTITPDKLQKGITAHDKTGTAITGTSTLDSDTSADTAAVAEILSGKTAHVKGAKLTGTMKNNGAVAGTISSADGAYTVPQGYHNGSGKVGIASAEKDKLVPANIKDGVTILGVKGTHYGGIKPEEYTYSQQRPEVTKYLDEVTYDPADYSTSQISNYVTTTSANQPTGQVINCKAAGTLVITDGYSNRVSKFEISAGNYTVYNLTPNAKSYFTLANMSGEIVQTGELNPTGDCRMLHMPNVQNARDIGGWACDGGKVRYGLLYRGGEIYENLTDVGKEYALGLLGIEREMSLVFDSDLNGRTESGFGSTVDMTHVDMTWNSLEWQKQNGNIPKLINPIFDNAIGGHPTYFHCSAGADRTGALALMLEAVLGVSQSDIDKDYELTCFFSGVSTDAQARRRNETTWTREINYINTYAGDTFRDKMVNFLVSCGITPDKINAFRKAMIDGNPQTLSPSVASYKVTNTLTSIATDNTATTAPQYQPYIAKLDGNGKVINSVKVTMGGIDITKSCFSGIRTTLNRSVSFSLSHCVASNERTWVIDGQSFVTKITANNGYTLKSVSIMMGGTDVSTYYAEGTIAIPQVTGDIVITATAEANAPAYTNQIANSIDMDGNALGKKWMYTNSRYNSSSGAPITIDGYNITGLISCKNNDTIRIRWSGKSGGTESYMSIKMFKADRTQHAAGYDSFQNITVASTFKVLQNDASNGVFDFTISSSYVSDLAYISIVLYEDNIDNVIVTVNEEIN